MIYAPKIPDYDKGKGISWEYYGEEDNEKEEDDYEEIWTYNEEEDKNQVEGNVEIYLLWWNFLMLHVIKDCQHELKALSIKHDWKEKRRKNINSKLN